MRRTQLIPLGVAATLAFAGAAVTIDASGASSSRGFTVSATATEAYGCGVYTRTITGTSRADELTGGTGNDRIIGNGGDDYLVGGKGADCLIGGSGDDTLEGSDGDDQIQGGPGADRVVPGRGRNLIQVNGDPKVATLSNRHPNDSVDCRDDSQDLVLMDRVDSAKHCANVRIVP